MLPCRASSAQRCPSLDPCCPGPPLTVREKPPPHTTGGTSFCAPLPLMPCPCSQSLPQSRWGASSGPWPPLPQRGACPARFPATRPQWAGSSARKQPMVTVGVWQVAESLCLLVPSSLLGVSLAWGGTSPETTFFPLAEGRRVPLDFRPRGSRIWLPDTPLALASCVALGRSPGL